MVVRLVAVPPSAAARPGGRAGPRAGRTSAPRLRHGLGGRPLTRRHVDNEDDLGLRFVGTRREPGKAYESGPLEDVFLTPDIRTNSIILSAPPKSMELMLALIRELDVQPAARAEINIFPLKKADAYAVATTLQQLFLGTGGVGTQRPGAVSPVGGTVGTTGPGGPRRRGGGGARRCGGSRGRWRLVAAPQVQPARRARFDRCS